MLQTGNAPAGADSERICPRRHTPSSPLAQGTLPDGAIITVNRDPENPRKQERPRLAIIHAFGEGRRELADPHGHGAPEDFPAWAARQPEPRRPKHVRFFRAGAGQAVAYTTEERIGNFSFFDAGGNAIPDLIGEEIREFTDWLDGELYQAGVYAPCHECGRPEGLPLRSEKGLQGTPERIVNEFRRSMLMEQE